MRQTATHRDASVEELSRNLSEMVEGIKERKGTAPLTKREAASNFEMNSAKQELMRQAASTSECDWKGFGEGAQAARIIMRDLSTLVAATKPEKSTIL